MNEVQRSHDEIHTIDHELTKLEEEFLHLFASLPNLPMDDIKVAQDPKENVEIKSWGRPSEFAFPFKNHLELNQKLRLFDFERGVKISGSGWPVYCGMGARLEWALINYMIDFHIKDGFQQWMVPLCVKKEIMFG